MKMLVSRLVYLNQKLRQKGAVSILAILGVGVGVGGVGIMMDATNDKIDQATYGNYAKAVAPVVLRTEMSITEQMLEGSGEDAKSLSEDAARNILAMVGQDGVDIEISFGKIQSLDGAVEREDPKTGVKIKVNEEFKSLQELGYSEEQTRNPRSSSNEPVEFNAVAVKISRDTLFGKAEGHAIFGLPSSVGEDDGEMSTCYCNSRFLSCMNADLESSAEFSSYPADLQNLIQNDRESYCMFGYTEAHPTEDGYSKYPNFTVFKEAVGHDPKKELTGKYAARFADAVAQKPLLNLAKDNQFPVARRNVLLPALGNSVAGYSPAPGNRIFFGIFGSATDTSGFLYADRYNNLKEKRSSLQSPYSNTSLNNYTVSSHTQPGGIFGIGATREDWVWPTGHYYVGQAGTCIAGTNESNAPKISAMLKAVNGDSVAKLTDSATNRCLSYKQRVDRDWATIWRVFKVPTPVNGYLQTSCADFNRFEETRVNFWQWLRNSFTWRFKQPERSYEGLDCAVRNMKWYGSFFWAGFYEK